MANAKWKALQWRDASRYDGQIHDKRCHGLGVLRHPNGDRYEGEFQNGDMNGYGVYVWKGETIYRGQWCKNQMEGCGVRISRKADGEFLIQEGQFVGDQFLGTFMDCSLSEARQAAAEADFIANQTRPFKAPPSHHFAAEHDRVVQNAEIYAKETDVTASPSDNRNENEKRATKPESWFNGFMRRMRGRM